MLKLAPFLTLTAFFAFSVANLTVLADEVALAPVEAPKVTATNDLDDLPTAEIIAALAKIADETEQVAQASKQQDARSGAARTKSEQTEPELTANQQEIMRQLGAFFAQTDRSDDGAAKGRGGFFIAPLARQWGGIRRGKTDGDRKRTSSRDKDSSRDGKGDNKHRRWESHRGRGSAFGMKKSAESRRGYGGRMGHRGFGHSGRHGRFDGQRRGSGPSRTMMMRRFAHRGHGFHGRHGMWGSHRKAFGKGRGMYSHGRFGHHRTHCGFDHRGRFGMHRGFGQGRGMHSRWGGRHHFSTRRGFGFHAPQFHGYMFAMRHNKYKQDKGGPGSMFKLYDTDNDGKISKAEVLKIFDKIDADQDGNITPAELMKSARSLFISKQSKSVKGKAKDNKDNKDNKASQSKKKPVKKEQKGSRSEESGQAAMPGQRGPFGFAWRGKSRIGGFGSALPFLLERFDRNNDGKLTEDEVPEPMWRMVKRYDSDADNVISRKEVEVRVKVLSTKTLKNQELD